MGLFHSLSRLGAPSLRAAVGSKTAHEPRPRPCAASAGDDIATAAAELSPTVDEAQARSCSVDKELRRLWVARDRASLGEPELHHRRHRSAVRVGRRGHGRIRGRAIQEAARFDGVKLPDDLKRQLHLLKLAQTGPGAGERGRARGARGARTWMTERVRQGQVLPAPASAASARTSTSSRVLRKSRKYDELLEAWTGWHAIAPPMRDKFTRYAELGNKGAREIGFADMGALWRSGYDMPPRRLRGRHRAALAARSSRSTTSFTATCARGCARSTARTRSASAPPFPPTCSATCGRRSGPTSTSWSSRTRVSLRSTSARS